uniref:PDZ domain-containing protein n=1 Tax=Elaeophora elaphi TaxID=1147741 RepID=A0A0R3S0T0_9BILA
MFNWSLSISSTTLKSVKSLSPSTSSSFSRAFLENITRSPFYHSFTSLDKTKLWSKFYVDDEENIQYGVINYKTQRFSFCLPLQHQNRILQKYGAIGKSFQKVLDAVSVDQKVITNPHSNRRRRTVIVTRNNGEPFGFTLQTYLLKRKGDDVPSKVTYVDYVQLDSPAADAGIRAGDVIISINGDVVTAMSHEELVKLIGSYHQMRMIVIFENIRLRIELIARAIKLRKILNDKLYQLNLIDIEEQKILNRAYLRSLSLRKTKYSLTNSLSSAGTSSVSSVSSAPSNSNGIANDAERSIVRIPTVISLTHGVIEISKYPSRKRTIEKPNLVEISNPRRSMNLRSNSGESNTSTGMEFLAVQRICCYNADLKHADRISSSSCDTGQTIDSLGFCSNPDDDDDTGNVSSSNCITSENDDSDGDSDNNVGDDDTAIGGAHVDTSDNIDNDKIDVFNPVLSNSMIATTTTTTTTTTSAPIPISESVFDSVALNHVIILDNDIISGEDDDDNDKVRILKL